MIQGDCSDCGKSTIVAGLCRLFFRRGIRVVPFKPQNMSNNACATAEGGEIGRAQALQAQAAGLAASIHMNPVLLKPESERGAQIIVQGTYRTSLDARGYHALKPTLLEAVLDSYHHIAANADLILIEGAGSAGEVNLRDGDIANMGFATAAGVPVIMLGDIHRGGVISSLIGLAAVLSPSDRRHVHGFMINRLRGDPSLFAPAIPFIEKRSGWPCLGTIPHFPPCHILPAEDSMALSASPPVRTTARQSQLLRIGVPVFPRIANFDDCDPLRLEPDVELIMVNAPEPLPADLDLILLPGSKSTLGDLAFLRAQGWHHDIAVHIRHGGVVLGICAGYQMLGRAIADPLGLEGDSSAASGLGHLSLSTKLDPHKRVTQINAVHCDTGLDVAGYEIHLGRMAGVDLDRPFLHINGQPEGAQSPSGAVMGTSVHGLFAADPFRRAFLDCLHRERRQEVHTTFHYQDQIATALDGLADHLENHVKIDRLCAIAGLT